MTKPYTEEDLEAAEKRGRAVGAANAVRNMQSTLGEAIREQREIAWDEGYLAGDPYHRRGDPLSSDNPYRPEGEGA